MAKELPYFRFYPSEWLEGDITLENDKTQGFFIKLCAWYWKKDCEIDLDFINKRLINNKAILKQCLKSLIDSNIVKVLENQSISISFLDEQFYILGEKRNKRVEAGRKGGKASVKQRLSYKDNNKDNEKENNIKDQELIEDESVIKTIDFLCKKFGVSEMLHFSNYKLIVNCVICQNNLGPEKFKHFKDQCWNYFIYKDLAKEKHHSFKSFVGTPEEQYLNGGWNSDNWIKKHTDIKAKESGIESTIYPNEENKTKVYPKSKRQSEPDLLKTITERKL